MRQFSSQLIALTHARGVAYYYQRQMQKKRTTIGRDEIIFAANVFALVALFDRNSYQRLQLERKTVLYKCRQQGMATSRLLGFALAMSSCVFFPLYWRKCPYVAHIKDAFLVISPFGLLRLRSYDSGNATLTFIYSCTLPSPLQFVRPYATTLTIEQRITTAII